MSNHPLSVGPLTVRHVPPPASSNNSPLWVVAVLGAIGLLAVVVWLFTASMRSPVKGLEIAVTQATHGEVFVANDGGGWERLEPGSALYDGYRVRTGVHSRAVLAFPSGHLLEIEGESTLLVRPLWYDDAGRELLDLSLASGFVRGHMSVAPGSPAAIRVLSGKGDVLAVLGARSHLSERLSYRIGSREESSVEIAMFSSSARIELAGRDIELMAGQSLTLEAAARYEENPPAVRDIPPAPVVQSPPMDGQLDLSEDKPALLSWQPTSSTAAYRVQLARDIEFERMILESLVDRAEISISPSDTGTYYFRIASRDEEGSEGPFGGIRRFTVLSLGETSSAKASSEPAVAAEGDQGLEEPVEHRLAVRALGRALLRQEGGKGSLTALMGEGVLGRLDVVKAERAGTLLFGADAALELEADAVLELTGSEVSDDTVYMTFKIESGAVLAHVMDSDRKTTLQLEREDLLVSVPNDLGPARIRAAVMDDRVRVVAEQGVAVLRVGAREHRLAAGRAVDRMNEGGSPRFMTVPRNPTPRAPGDGATFSSLEGSPEVAFSWHPVHEAPLYRVRITTGGQLFIQSLSRTPRLIHGTLPPGTYQWSVQALTEDGLESLTPVTRTFTIVRAGARPSITITHPDDGSSTKDSEIVLSGRSSPNSTILVNGRQVETGESGDFQAIIELELGDNWITVETRGSANAIARETIHVIRHEE